MDKIIKNIIRILLFIFFSYIIIGMLLSERIIVRLGAGYKYNLEIRYIGSNKNGKEIPPRIIEYKYDRDYIIAKQKPTYPSDFFPEYHDYKFGLDTTYYWLIIKKRDEIVGPVDSIEMQILYNKYNVPKNIHLD